MDFIEQYNYMIDNNIVSEETLKIITDINGDTIDTLNDVLFCVTGYRDIEQFINE